MPIYRRSLILLAKLDTTYGTDPVPTGAANAVRAKNAKISPMEGQDLPRDLDLPAMGNQGTIPADLHMKLEFEIELAPSGTAGTRLVQIQQRLGSSTLSVANVDVVTDATERRFRFNLLVEGVAGTGTTGRMSALGLRRRMNGALLVDGAVTAQKINAGAITTEKLAAGAVTADQIAANAVTAVKLAAGAIEADKIAANAVTAGKIATDAVTAGTIAAAAVNAREIAAGAVMAEKLTVLARDLVNNPTRTKSLVGWGGVTEAGTGGNAAQSYDTTEDALKLTSSGNLSTRCQSFQIDHDKIYRVSFRVKKDQAIGQMYVGLIGLTAPTAGAVSTSSATGTQLFTPYNSSRVAVTDTNNPYFTGAFAATTSYVEFVCYLIGANRSISDCPNHSGSASQPYVKASVGASHIQLRALNWGNGTTTASLYLKDIAVTEVGGGQIVSDNIAANAITADKILAGSVTSDKIAANAVDATKISAGSITAEKIAAGAITTEKLAASNIITSEMIVGGAVARRGIIYYYYAGGQNIAIGPSVTALGNVLEWYPAPYTNALNPQNPTVVNITFSASCNTDRTSLTAKIQRRVKSPVGSWSDVLSESIKLFDREATYSFNFADINDSIDINQWLSNNEYRLVFSAGASGVTVFRAYAEFSQMNRTE